MPFRPLNSGHAIESVGFSLDMDRLFSQDEILAIRDGHQYWYERLPGVQFDEEPAPCVARFAFLQPDGTPSWALTVNKNRIHIVCRQYTRWNNVWEQTLKIFQAVSKVFSANNSTDEPLHISRIIFEVDDVFISDEPDKSQLSELFISDTPRLLGSIFESDFNWHQNTGSFVEWPSDFICLEQVNLKSNIVTASPNSDNEVPEKLAIVKVKHAQSLSIIDSKMYPLSTYLSSDKNPLSKDMNGMHDMNKKFLRDLLTKEMRDTINLNSGER